MKVAKGMVDEHGKERKNLLKCEHCGNYMVMQEPVKPKDVVCGKCGMTTDKE
jgi:ribosomal protein S27AE